MIDDVYLYLQQTQIRLIGSSTTVIPFVCSDLWYKNTEKIIKRMMWEDLSVIK